MRQQTRPDLATSEGLGASGSALGETFGLHASSPAGSGGAGKSKVRLLDPARDAPVDVFFISAGLVAIAEIGDKTQLLAMLLAARYRQPRPIIAGILVATLANHALAAWAGAEVAAWVGIETMRWILGASFAVMAAWCLLPDKADAGPRRVDAAGAFVATTVAFFLVEIGDKTQIATVALAARFQDVVLTTAGTTLGMMLANVPAVLFGEVVARRMPLKWIRRVAALSFAVLGAVVVAFG